MKTKSKLCLLLAALLAVLTALPALASVPGPSKEFYYLDQANVLSEETEGEIFFSNQLLDKACGAQIVVVTTKSTKPDAIDDYTVNLFNKWGIGDKDKQNGFLLVMAIEDDDYYAVCGSNLQPKFTSGTLKQYFDDYLETDFAAKRYDDGARAFFEAVFKRVADIYNANVDTAQGVAAYRNWAADANAAPMSASAGGGAYGASRGNGEEGRSDGMLIAVVIVLIIVLAVVLPSRRRYRTYYGGSGGWFPFFLGTMIGRRRTPPPPGPGGVRGAPGPRPGGSFRSTGGAGRSSGGLNLSSILRSSGGSSRSAFGGGRSSGGSFGSARGGGGSTRGGGAGRGRH